MTKRTMAIFGGLFLALAGVGAGFVVAMRSKYPPVQDAVRNMTRDVVNPKVMETAGKPGAYAAVIHHAGRTTGTGYDTPVQATATPEGFVIPLPYGTGTDWYKNLLAAESATIDHQGITYKIDAPAVIQAADADPYMTEKDRKTHRFYGVDEFLSVHRIEENEEEPIAAPA